MNSNFFAFLCFRDLVVASPVEDYFLYIDDLPDPDKVRIHTLSPTYYQVECSKLISYPCISWQKEAEEITRPFLDALGDDYSVCCQGMMSFCSSFSIKSSKYFDLLSSNSSKLSSFVLLGTAFYSLQSCMNHSCTPNAKAFKREEVYKVHIVFVGSVV